MRTNLATLGLKLAVLLIVFESISAPSRADTMLPSVTVSGMVIKMGMLGNGKREKPNSRIVVCSDGRFDDVSNLRKVARKFFPGESYEIVDGAESYTGRKNQDSTFAYFGSAPMADSGCLDRSPGLKEYVALRAQLSHTAVETQNEILKKQFNTKKDVLMLNSICSFGGAAAEIDGRKFPWSVHLRGNRNCMESYWSVFGVTKLCLTQECGYAETEKIFKLIEN